MEFEKVKNKGQARIFENKYLEMMTKTHPFVIYAIYFPVIIYMLYYGATRKGLPVSKEALLFTLGLFFWTLFEYVAHRYLFHWVAHSIRSKRLVYILHGVHHEYPRDKMRLFMPPVPSVIVASTIFSLMYLVLGWYALALFPGFIFGYILYGSMHYAIHAFAPPRFMKALWRNHHLHHYKAHDKGFGVSSVLWDIVFGTVPEKEVV